MSAFGIGLEGPGANGRAFRGPPRRGGWSTLLGSLPEHPFGLASSCDPGQPPAFPWKQIMSHIDFGAISGSPALPRNCPTEPPRICPTRRRLETRLGPPEPRTHILRMTPVSTRQTQSNHCLLLPRGVSLRGPTRIQLSCKRTRFIAVEVYGVCGMLRRWASPVKIKQNSIQDLGGLLPSAPSMLRGGRDGWGKIAHAHVQH